MYKILIVYIIILILVIGDWCSDFRQEGAKIKYWNPKYLNDCTVFTSRKSRHEPYTTNMTGTMLVPFGNNVSLLINLEMKTGGDFRIVTKICDTLRYKWMMDYMRTFTNISSTCPFPPNTYKMYNMEFPPKNIPLPIIEGDYFMRLELFVTATKEPIVEMTVLLRFEKKKIKRNKV